MSEDAPANSVAAGGVAGLTGIPPVSPQTKFPIVRRKKPMIGENKKSTITVAVPVEIDGKKYSAVRGQAYVHSTTIMGRWNTSSRKMRRALKPGPHHDKIIAALEKHEHKPESIEEQENDYALHVAGKKLTRKPRRITDMTPPDEYPPSPVIREEVEDYVVAFTLPVFVRSLEIAREKIKSDDELHVFVENIVNLQGEDVLTMEDVMDVFDEYSGD